METAYEKDMCLFLSDPNEALQEEQHQAHTVYVFIPDEGMSKPSFFKVNHMQEQGCSGGLEITGINNLPSPTKQEPGKAPWVVFCTSTYELGVF